MLQATPCELDRMAHDVREDPSSEVMRTVSRMQSCNFVVRDQYLVARSLSSMLPYVPIAGSIDAQLRCELL